MMSRTPGIMRMCNHSSIEAEEEMNLRKK